MTLLGEMQFLERLHFFNGQRLFATDLQALEAFNREMRWLHNQSLHQPGIGSGYAVTGKKGDREVSISPGYAIDRDGREIVLTQTHTEPVPPVADDGSGKPVFYDLTVSYPADSDLKETETREGICLPAGAVRLREAPIFCWVRLGADYQPVDPDLKQQLQENVKIRLARAEVLNCQLKQPLCTAPRRNARIACRPYIGCGMFRPHPNNWRIWSDKTTRIRGLEVAVDTSSARFRTTPCYCAHIVGDRFFTLEIGQQRVNFLLDGFTNVINPTATGFTLRVLMPQINIAGETLLSFNPAHLVDEKIFKLGGLLKDHEVHWIGSEA